LGSCQPIAHHALRRRFFSCKPLALVILLFFAERKVLCWVVWEFKREAAFRRDTHSCNTARQGRGDSSSIDAAEAATQSTEAAAAVLQCAKTCASVCCRCGHVPRSVCLCYRLGCPAKMSYPLIFTLSHSPVIRNRSLCLPHLSPTLVVRYCTPAEASPLPPSLSLSRFHLMGIGSSVAGARLALAVRFPYIRCTPPRSPRSRPAT
jgi:hypothetical protein